MADSILALINRPGQQNLNVSSAGGEVYQRYLQANQQNATQNRQLALQRAQILLGDSSAGRSAGGGGSGEVDQSLADQRLALERKKSENDLLDAQATKIYQESKQLALNGDYARYGEALSKVDPGASASFQKAIQMFANNYAPQQTSSSQSFTSQAKAATGTK